MIDNASPMTMPSTSAPTTPTTTSSSTTPSVPVSNTTSTTSGTVAPTSTQPPATSTVPGVESSDSNSEFKTETQGNEQPQSDTRKYKVKIDGLEQEVTEQELLTGYQRAQASQARLEKANRIEQQAQRFIEALQRDPVSMMSNPKLGINFREIAENYLYEQIQTEMMSPEERAIAQERAELQKYKQQEHAQLQARKEAKLNEMRDRYANEYTQKFTTALESTGLPKTQWTVARMANYVQQSLQAKVEPDLNEIASIVREDYIAEQKALFGSLDGDRLIETLGEDFAKKVRQAELAKLKAKNPMQQTLQSQQPREQKTEKLLDRSDWKRELMRNAGLG